MTVLQKIIDRLQILLFRTTKSWMLHADGLGLLLRLRGPWQQKSYAKTSIFLEHRIVLVRDFLFRTVQHLTEYRSESQLFFVRAHFFVIQFGKQYLGKTTQHRNQLWTI